MPSSVYTNTLRYKHKHTPYSYYRIHTTHMSCNIKRENLLYLYKERVDYKKVKHDLADFFRKPPLNEPRSFIQTDCFKCMLEMFNTNFCRLLTILFKVIYKKLKNIIFTIVKMLLYIIKFSSKSVNSFNSFYTGPPYSSFLLSVSTNKIDSIIIFYRKKSSLYNVL